MNEVWQLNYWLVTFYLLLLLLQTNIYLFWSVFPETAQFLQKKKLRSDGIGSEFCKLWKTVVPIHACMLVAMLTINQVHIVVICIQRTDASFVLFHIEQVFSNVLSLKIPSHIHKWFVWHSFYFVWWREQPT